MLVISGAENTTVVLLSTLISTRLRRLSSCSPSGWAIMMSEASPSAAAARDSPLSVADLRCTVNPDEPPEKRPGLPGRALRRRFVSFCQKINWLAVRPQTTAKKYLGDNPQS
jgi:hypothetical protein